MRRFLYYDEDSINSFVAQIEKGLLTKKGKEKEITDTVSSQLDTTSDITGDLSAKVIGIGASLKGDIQTTDSDTEATSKLVKNVQEKVLHDYAFDKVFEYMTSDHLLVESPPIYWRYYTTKRTSYIPRFRIFSETFFRKWSN